MIISLPTNRNCRGSKGLFYLNADKLESFMDATEKIQSVPHYSSNKQFPDLQASQHKATQGMCLTEQELKHREARSTSTGSACLTSVLEGDFIILGRKPTFSSFWRTILNLSRLYLFQKHPWSRLEKRQPSLLIGTCTLRT